MHEERIREIFASLGAISIRKMFGGAGIYHQGLMFALEANGEVYLKADSLTADAFAAAGSTPFTYSGKGKAVTMSYWRLLERAYDEPDELLRWVRLALDAALRAQKKR